MVDGAADLISFSGFLSLSCFPALDATGGELFSCFFMMLPPGNVHRPNNPLT